MKSVTSLVIALAFGSAAMSATAADRKEQELAVCATELKAYYGQDTQIKLISRQSGLYGTQLRVSARVDRDNARFASCWVDTDELSAIELEDPAEQVVAVDPLNP